MSATISLSMILFVVGFYELYFDVLISLNEPEPFEGKQHQPLLNQKKMLN